MHDHDHDKSRKMTSIFAFLRCNEAVVIALAVSVVTNVIFLYYKTCENNSFPNGQQHGNDINKLPLSEPTVIIGNENKWVNIESEAKWARYTDRSTLPDRLALRGDLEGCSGNVRCSNYQKLLDANELMHMPAEIKCDQIRMVGKGDGEGGQLPYHVCFDRPYRPKHGQCLIYSFGISNDWSFDDAMANKSHTDCKVFSFDPSINLTAHKRGENIQFYPWGIATSDNRWKTWEMRSLSSIYKQLGHENEIIDIFKIDVEGAEVAVFQQLIDDGFIQKYVKQILIEWHPVGDTRNVEKLLAPYYRLRHEAGFRAFYNEPRPFMRNSIMLVESLVNTKFSTT